MGALRFARIRGSQETKSFQICVGHVIFFQQNEDNLRRHVDEYI